MSTTISTPNLSEAQKQILKSQNEKPIIVKSQTLEFNRAILEYGKFNVLLSPEKHSEKPKDKPKALDSGLNHVLAKIAAKNKIAVGIEIQEISNLEKKEKAQRLARIKQNIKICRKAKCQFAIINYKDKIDSFNFLLSLGASTQQAKEAIYYKGD